ncbi:arfaptin-2-like isoform X1 [Cyprinodon tularosa]|uniref:arfaptin-2-like isoform X1 n=1 Tax=Cyprinodon tularosa TaxID=77115 RepID=UPI0018E26EC3|nr:arfaptin-2-like isoform X1 [Cyprinodon tularosa]
MADNTMSKAATMEIPINSNGDTGALTEDDSLEQDLQQVMVSGPNLNETSIVSGGYGGPAGGIIPTSSIKGPAVRYNPEYLDRRRTAAPGLGGSSSFGVTIFSLLLFIATMLISDIRMKSRGANLHNSNASASRLAHHTNPGSINHNTNSTEEVSRGVAVEKLDSVKKWGINTYKCTKQMFSEKFGRGSRTVDLELEAQIDVLRDTKSKYENILRLATALITHFQSMVQTQQALGDTFTDLSQKSPELQDEFGYNAETQKLLCKNGEALLGAINFFVSSVNTLVNKTMEDTLLTIRQYENARLEFDAYRSDLEELSLGPRDAAAMVRIEMAQQDYQVHREKYERLRSDVSIKLKFLEENKVKVMHKQLLLFHNAISAYFAGNQQQLEQTLIQFNVKLKPPGSDKPSWLEEQ